MRHGHPARPHATESEMFTRQEIDAAHARIEKMCDRLDTLILKQEWLTEEETAEMDSLERRIARLEEKVDRAEWVWRHS